MTEKNVLQCAALSVALYAFSVGQIILSYSES